MFSYRNSSIRRRLLLAALVGSACGAAAGVWSIGRAPAVREPAAAPGAVIRHDPVSALPVRPVQDPAKATPVSARSRIAPALPPVSQTTNASDPDALLHARELAQRADVNGLLAMRDDLVRHAEQRGETGAPSSKQQLDEFDRYLTEARWLRLKLDAEVFKHTETSPGRAR